MTNLPKRKVAKANELYAAGEISPDELLRRVVER
jgi:hypothetical protein